MVGIFCWLLFLALVVGVLVAGLVQARGSREETADEDPRESVAGEGSGLTRQDDRLGAHRQGKGAFLTRFRRYLFLSVNRSRVPVPASVPVAVSVPRALATCR